MEKEGEIISGKLGRESPEELTVVSAAAATGGRGEMGAATGTAAREPCSAAALLQPSSSLLQNQKQSTASYLPPAVCCPGQQPVSPVVWTCLSGPFSINIWDWVHHLAKGQSQHLLRREEEPKLPTSELTTGYPSQTQLTKKGQDWITSPLYSFLATIH